MHSFFGIKPGGSAHDMVQPPSNLGSLARRHDGVEVVVIDEISMAGPLLLGQANSRSAMVAADLGRQFPPGDVFGGVPCVVMLGDFYQLDPFGNEQNNAIHSIPTGGVRDIEVTKRALEAIRSRAGGASSGASGSTAGAGLMGLGRGCVPASLRRTIDKEKNDVKKQTGYVASHFQRQGYETFKSMQNVVMLMENNRQANADPRYAKCLLNCRYVCWSFGDWAESCMF